MLSRRNPNALPFDDASSLEFLMQKNNCGMFAVASHSKKRPDNLTLVSCAAGSARRGPWRGRLITCALRAARAGANFRWADPRHG